MRLWEVVVTGRDERTGSLIAESITSSTQRRETFGQVVVLKLGDNFLLPVKLNTPALLLQSDAGNILLGYYDPSDKGYRKKTTVIDGDMFLTCGKTRAVRLSADGNVEVCATFVKDDGTIVHVPMMSYSMNNELKISVESLMIDMFGGSAGGNIVWTQDPVTGFNTFEENYKTNNKDIGPRIYKKIEGSPTGPSIKYIWDVTASPVGGVLPSMISTALPLSIGMNISPAMPIEFALKAGPAPLFAVTLSPLGELVIKNSVTQASITMSPLGDMTLQSAASLAKINMSASGKIDIDSKTTISINGLMGADITGMGTSLMTMLQQFFIAYTTHIHATGVGPSSPPVVPNTFALQAVKLKGGA